MVFSCEQAELTCMKMKVLKTTELDLVRSSSWSFWYCTCPCSAARAHLHLCSNCWPVYAAHMPAQHASSFCRAMQSRSASLCMSERVPDLGKTCSFSTPIISIRPHSHQLSVLHLSQAKRADRDTASQATDLGVQLDKFVVASTALWVAGFSLAEVGRHGLGAGVAARNWVFHGALPDLAQRHFICAASTQAHHMLQREPCNHSVLSCCNMKFRSTETLRNGGDWRPYSGGCVLWRDRVASPSASSRTHGCPDPAGYPKQASVRSRESTERGRTGLLCGGASPGA